MDELTKLLENAGIVKEYEDDGADPGVAISVMKQSCETVMRFGAEGLLHAAMEGDMTNVDDEQIDGVAFTKTGAIIVDLSAYSDGEYNKVSVTVTGASVKGNW